MFKLQLNVWNIDNLEVINIFKSSRSWVGEMDVHGDPTQRVFQDNPLYESTYTLYVSERESKRSFCQSWDMSLKNGLPTPSTNTETRQFNYKRLSIIDMLLNTLMIRSYVQFFKIRAWKLRSVKESQKLNMIEGIRPHKSWSHLNYLFLLKPP